MDIEIGKFKDGKLNTKMIGSIEARRTVRYTNDTVIMIVIMSMTDQAYCHQNIKNPNRNYPAGWVGVDLSVPQEPYLISDMRIVKIRNAL